MNKVILTGRLAKEPEARYTQSGKCVTTITLAVKRPYVKDREPEADFITCIVWNKQGEAVANYCNKGDRLNIEGSMQVRTYEGKDGKTHWTTEVIARDVEFVETKRDKGSMASTSYSKPSSNTQGSHEHNFDEEVPF